MVAHLGHARFQNREAATRRLIAIGTSSEHARQRINLAMKKLWSHQDPEVSERAKRILQAINPQPKKRPVDIDGFTGAS